MEKIDQAWRIVGRVYTILCTYKFDHGPDEKQRKARLRLDTHEGAFKKLRKDGFAIVPGSYSSAARKLLTTNAPTKVGTPAQAGTGCAAVAGPGA